jgi:hypothetical protein
MFDTRFRFKGLEECIGGLERVMRSPDWVGRIRFQRGRGLVPRDVRNEPLQNTKLVRTRHRIQLLK